MFNQLSPAQVVAAVGEASLAAARQAVNGADMDFASGQLFSAGSSCRHLAVELEYYPAVLARFADAAAAIVAGQGEIRADLQVLGALVALDAARDARSTGAAVCDLLAAVRATGLGGGDAVIAGVRSLMRALSEEEVELLARAIEPGADR
jgi:hypothetical protein